MNGFCELDEVAPGGIDGESNSLLPMFSEDGTQIASFTVLQGTEVGEFPSVVSETCLHPLISMKRCFGIQVRFCAL